MRGDTLRPGGTTHPISDSQIPQVSPRLPSNNKSPFLSRPSQVFIFPPENLHNGPYCYFIGPGQPGTGEE